jgi:spermidine synthase
MDGPFSHPVIFEQHDDSHGSYFLVEKVLFREQSEFQEVMVFETKRHGRVLFIDRQMMFTSTTVGPYNESMAHIPMSLHARPKKVLIVGGGDACVLREILRYPTVERVVLAELDGLVLEATTEYFPKIASAFEDPRVEIRVGSRDAAYGD